MRDNKRKATPTSADDKANQMPELRFKPANSNDAARAVFSHHFTHVPKCSFAKDDGISQYMGSETGIESAPASPRDHVPLHDDVPQIANETPEAGKRSRFKLLRDAFAVALVLHAVAALAIFFVKVPMPEDPSQMEGETVINLVVQGDVADMRSAGEADAPDEAEETPVVTEKKPIEKPVETPPEPVKQPEPVQAKAEEILKDVPMPDLGAEVPEILTARDQAEPKVQAPAQAVAEEKPVEPVPLKAMAPPPEKLEPEPKAEPVVKSAQPLPHPVSKPREIVKTAEAEPKPAEKLPEVKKEEPKAEKHEVKKGEKKEKPAEKPKKRRGNQANAEASMRRGAEESKQKGRSASEASSGGSNNREIGNAARSNYTGIVNRKLNRAKSRVRNPGRGRVTVAFTISANGNVSGIRISRSSGDQRVDEAALKIVDRAAPFPAIPAEANRRSWPMSVPILFK